MSRTCAIIQARQGSTRFSGKAVVRIKGQTVLGWVVKRLQAVNILEPLLDDIIVITTKKEEDNIIEAWCKHNKVTCFRGSELDVLKRYYDCAKHYSADWILRITADCPFIDPVLLYGLLTKHPRKDYQALAVNNGSIPDGYDAELFSFKALEKAMESTAPLDREHVGRAMRRPNEDGQDYGTEFNFKGIKLSLDTEEDYKRMCAYAEYI